ncbi:MAG: ThiF family adenylyltransferase [Chloroflexota bacterium]
MNTFEPHTGISNIVLVGAGGTGAQLARNIARILYDMQTRSLHVPTFTIIDPDTVSSSNIGRSLFTKNEIGENKASLLARRFNLALGLDISAIPQRFDQKRHLHHPYNTLLIGAVDNAAARREMSAAQCLSIDAGNSKTTGQIACGNLHSPAQLDQYLKAPKEACYRSLPSPYLVFPDLLIDEAQPEQTTPLSCAQLVELNTQHLFINDLVACAATSSIAHLLHRAPLQHWITFVSIDGPTVRSIEITPESIQHYAHIKNRKNAAA